MGAYPARSRNGGSSTRAAAHASSSARSRATSARAASDASAAKCAALAFRQKMTVTGYTSLLEVIIFM